MGGGKYRLPETIIWNCNGVITDCCHKVVTVKEAIKRISDYGSAIIKPTVDTSSGEGVRLIKMKSGMDERTGETAEEVLQSYHHNYIVQEYIEQSRYLSNIYSGSLNTFRVISYICEGQVSLAPIAMRIGSNGSYLDNLHAGGMGIGIHNDNTLRKAAFTEMGERYEKHPDSGVIFDGYAIPPIDGIRKAAVELHGRIPQIQMISWDWALDKNDIPILIEINISGQAVWFPQMLNGEPIFGEHTEYFANLIRE